MQELCLDETRSLNDAGHGTDKYALSHMEMIRHEPVAIHSAQLSGTGCLVPLTSDSGDVSACQ